MYFNTAGQCRDNRKAIYMSFKEFSSAQGAANGDTPGAKSVAAPTAGKPAAKSDKIPAEAAPAAKS